LLNNTVLDFIDHNVTMIVIARMIWFQCVMSPQTHPTDQHATPAVHIEWKITKLVSHFLCNLLVILLMWRCS